MTTNKKIDKYRKALYSFLTNYKLNGNSTEKHTHTTYGSFFGKYLIPKDYSKEFIKLYCDAINNNVDDLSILEVQPEYGPLIIDIDLKVPIDCSELSGERLYENDLIMIIIDKYMIAINKYLEIKDTNKFKIVVFEKNNKIEFNDIYKY